MSQKKIKKLKRQEVVVQKIDVVGEKVLGIRGILKENWKFLLILCIGVFLLYFNSLKGNFVSDDYATVSQNVDVLNLRFVWSTKSLPLIINHVIISIFGIESPLPYHTFNLFLYVLVCILSFVFIRLLFSGRIAKLTTILFAVIPIHVEAVSWISGRPYLLVALFILLSLDFLILYLKKRQQKYLWFIVPNLFLLFMTDRVRGSALIFLGLLYFLIFRKQLVYRFKVGKIILIVIAIMTVLAVVSWPMIVTRINTVNGGTNVSDSIFYNPFFQYPTAIAKYLQLIFVPIDLTLYHTMYILPKWVNWMILLNYLALVIYFLIKNQKIFFALAFIFLAAAPSMAPVKVSWLVAERYVFLGSLGFCLLLAIIFDSLMKKYKIISITIFSLLLCFYIIRVYLRNIDWQTNHNLWVNTCQTSPNSHNAWNNIGDDYDKLKQYNNAVKGFTQSTVVKPNYADAYHNRANIFYKTGRLDLARDSYNTALYYSPGLVQTYFSLTQIDFMEKRMDLALEHAQKAVQLQPNNPQALYVLGVVYVNTGMIKEAKEILIPLLQQYPQFKQVDDLLRQIKSQQ